MREIGLVVLVVAVAGSSVGDCMVVGMRRYVDFKSQKWSLGEIMGCFMCPSKVLVE